MLDYPLDPAKLYAGIRDYARNKTKIVYKKYIKTDWVFVLKFVYSLFFIKQFSSVFNNLSRLSKVHLHLVDAFPLSATI